MPYLGHACRDARLAANSGRGIKLIHIAAELDRSEATMSRFERGEVQPIDVDATVLAYARELEINPLALWAAALDLAKDEGVSREFDEPKSAERTATAGEAMERLGQEAKQQQGQRHSAARKRAS